GPVGEIRFLIRVPERENSGAIELIEDVLWLEGLKAIRWSFLAGDVPHGLSFLPDNDEQAGSVDTVVGPPGRMCGNFRGGGLRSPVICVKRGLGDPPAQLR